MNAAKLSVMALVAAGVLCTLASWQTGWAQATSAPAAAPATKAAGEVAKETWDWATAMSAVAKKGKGKAGMVMLVGDSITRNANANRWATGVTGGAAGYDASDKAILQWSKADQKDSDGNGWGLANTDVNDDRTNTAAKNLTTEGLLKGGPGDLPPLAKLIEKYKPQVVVLLVGLTDAAKNVKVEDVAANMGKAIDQTLEAGVVPILVTLPPDKTALAAVKAINAKYLALAKEKNIPIIDLYGEILTRQPGEAWVNTLTDKDGRKLSIENAAGPATPENLKKSGMLLKCWLVAQKLKAVKADVLGKK